MSSFLLIGLGKLGINVAEKLSELNQQVMVVDKDESRVDAAMPFATKGQIGDSTNKDFLSSLGVNHFDICMVTIGDDFQSSLETVSLLQELGAKKVVAYAVSDVHAKFLRRNGADDVVQPSKQIAEWIAARYTSSHVLSFVDMDNECSIFELKIPKTWVGRTIQEVDVRRNYGINIIALKQNDKLNMMLSGETKLEDSATMLIIGTMEAMRKLVK